MNRTWHEDSDSLALFVFEIEYKDDFHISAQLARAFFLRDDC